MRAALVLAGLALAAPAAAQSEALELAVGASSAARHLTFSGDAADALGAYRLDVAPALQASLTWLPLRHARAEPWAGLGVVGRARGVLGVSSESGQGEARASYASTVDDLAVGASYRIAFAPIELEAELAYGEARFRVEPPGPTTPSSARAPFPSVRYRFVRPALAVRVALPEGFSIQGGGGWRGVLESGPLAHPEWFPRSFTTGLDLALEVRWRFHRWVAARVRAEHVRWITELRPAPGDLLLADGALDEQTYVGADLIFVMPGVER